MADIGPEVVIHDHEPRFSSEDWKWVDGFVNFAPRFLANEAPDPEVLPETPPFNAQHDAYSPHQEHQRDLLVYGLGLTLQLERSKGRLGLAPDIDLNIERSLNNSERLRRAQGETGALVRPWMKKWFGIDDPDTPVQVSEGVERFALLKADHRFSWWLHEVEFPDDLTDTEGQVQQRFWKRVLWYARYPNHTVATAE